jgi:hypothetical protein
MLMAARQASARRRILEIVTETLPPVAIRVVRPHASEEEILENELETLTRTSITLLGAQPRPPGLVLRFELALSSGQPVVRGEGRVVGYKPDAHYGMGGLTLRFTRLDTRSKAFVDRAAALRERRRPPIGHGNDSLPPASVSLPPDEEPPSTDGAELLATQDVAPASSRPASLEGPQGSPPRRDRDALLERLRARSKTLGEDTLASLLDRRR